MRGDAVLDDKPVTHQRNLAELPPAAVAAGRAGTMGRVALENERGEKLYFVASEPQRPASLTDPEHLVRLRQPQWRHGRPGMRTASLM